MLYLAIKALMKIALRIFYRRIEVEGLENIPLKGPAIIIANHPSSLMDAVIVGLQVKRPVYFFTRGDIFINKWISYLLSRLHMIPVYTHEEGGRNTIAYNEASYEKAEEILTAGGLLLFFPEGNSRPGHHLMPLRKGVFRMAFQAAEKNEFRYDITFIPTGINYEDPVKSNQTVMVNFGKPFLLSSYRQDWSANPRATLLQLCKEGFAAMEKTVLHIKNNADRQLAERCLVIARNRPAVENHLPDSGFDREKKVCNELNDSDTAFRAALEAEMNNYFNALEQYGLVDSTLLPQFRFSVARKVLLWLTAPLYAIGFLLNVLPIALARRIADTRVYRQDFYSWIFLTSSLVLYIFWLLLLGLASWAAGGWSAVAVVVPATVLTGFFALNYRHWKKDYVQHRRLKQLSPPVLTDLRDKRNKLAFR